MHRILNTMFSMIFVTALAATVLGAPVPRTRIDQPNPGNCPF